MGNKSTCVYTTSTWLVTYCVSCNHVRVGVVPAKIQANFHTRVAATNDQNPLVLVIRTRFIDAGVNNGSAKLVHARNRGNNGFSILSSSNHKPRRNVLKTIGFDDPKLRTRVELGGLNGLVEPGADVEA